MLHGTVFSSLKKVGLNWVEKGLCCEWEGGALYHNARKGNDRSVKARGKTWSRAKYASRNVWGRRKWTQGGGAWMALKGGRRGYNERMKCVSWRRQYKKPDSRGGNEERN